MAKEGGGGGVRGGGVRGGGVSGGGGGVGGGGLSDPKPATQLIGAEGRHLSRTLSHWHTRTCPAVGPRS